MFLNIYLNIFLNISLKLQQDEKKTNNQPLRRILLNKFNKVCSLDCLSLAARVVFNISFGGVFLPPVNLEWAAKTRNVYNYVHTYFIVWVDVVVVVCLQNNIC